MSGEKLSVELEIKNRKGLHARAAAAFVKAIENLDARVEVDGSARRSTAVRSWG